MGQYQTVTDACIVFALKFAIFPKFLSMNNSISQDEPSHLLLHQVLVCQHC